MNLLYNNFQVRRDRYFLINYNQKNYRLVLVKSCRLPGFECNNKGFVDVNSDEVKRISLSRTKKNIRELALCNDFEYFCTFTVNSVLCDRYSLDDCQERLKKILHKIKRKNKEFGYLLITEKHKDGAFHFHGLVKGINDLYQNEFGYYCSYIFTTELGYNSFSPIKSYEKCCNYITKYITKDCIKNSHNQVYICSRGLKKAEKTEIKPFSFVPTFSNDYVKIQDFDVTKLSRLELLDYLKIENV